MTAEHTTLHYTSHTSCDPTQSTTCRYSTCFGSHILCLICSPGCHHFRRSQSLACLLNSSICSRGLRQQYSRDVKQMPKRCLLSLCPHNQAENITTTVNFNQPTATITNERRAHVYIAPCTYSPRGILRCTSDANCVLSSAAGSKNE
jgi:CxxC motif-containing protein